MSNFSHNENDQISSSETEFEPNGCDNTVAFLAALEETQQVLNILLQAATNRYDADAHLQNNSLISFTELDNTSNDFLKYEYLNEEAVTRNQIDNKLYETADTNKSKFNSSNLLGPSFNPIEGTLQAKIIKSNNLEIKPPLVCIEQGSLETTNIFVNNKKYHRVSEFDTTPPNIIWELKPETFLDGEVSKDTDETNISAVLNNRNNGLTNLSYNLPQNPLKLTLSKFKNKHSLEPKTKTNEEESLQIPLEANNNFDSPSSMLKEEPIKDVKKDLEQTVSTLERGILLKGETLENRKTPVLQLPLNSMSNSPSRCEKEIVGDDHAKTRNHILCECDQPGVAGGAVPVVTSFTLPQRYSQKVDDTISENKTHISKSNIPQAGSNPLKPKPSLIPKLTSSFRNTNKSNFLGRTEKQRCLVPCSSPDEDDQMKPIGVNIHSRLKSLQEKLKASTSIIKQKISNNGEKSDVEKNKSQNEKPHQLRFDDESFERQRRQKKLHNELSKRINKIAHDVTNLAEINNINVQTAVIDNLYKHIMELKKISNELNNILSRDNMKMYATDKSQDTNDNQPPDFELGNKTKSKDNKIYIKFLPTKSGVKKRKGCNTEVQTESTKQLPSNITEDPKTTRKSSNGENGIKDEDSIDGMFIPSMEEPPKMEEEEDEEGLDITITFPEFQQHVIHQASSHLSVCFSDISAEALGRLKRCPKEFTLRMDFIHGKMFFQSGRSPANNFSIGPDLKITECVIDNKMSDIISIKPSTECVYTSQIIPVEGEKRRSSIKTLKSTDSELFNVVSLPRINRKTSGNTKSCITFKSEHYVSVGSLLSDRRSYKSMPQIPSLTKILEEPALECVSTSRAAMTISEKKPKSRTLSKKKTNTSLDKLSDA